jgi:hypothetical protein
VEQRGLILGGDFADSADSGNVSGHEGEGLVGAAFSTAECGDGGFVGCVAGEEKAAEAFDGEDASGAEERAGFADGCEGIFV